MGMRSLGAGRQLSLSQRGRNVLTVVHMFIMPYIFALHSLAPVSSGTRTYLLISIMFSSSDSAGADSPLHPLAAAGLSVLWLWCVSAAENRRICLSPQPNSLARHHRTRTPGSAITAQDYDSDYNIRVFVNSPGRPARKTKIGELLRLTADNPDRFQQRMRRVPRNSLRILGNRLRRSNMASTSRTIYFATEDLVDQLVE